MPFLSFSQESKKILLKMADVLAYNKPENPDVQYLKGNVVFQHENSFMYCDSALLYINQNKMEAFGHVHVRVSDTTQIYGNKLLFDANSKIAIMEEKVELIDNNIVLHTEKLYYDIGNAMGYYLDSAEIQDPNNKLTSRHGYYFSGKKEFFFRHNVVVTGNNFKLTSDSLMYNTNTELIRFYGNTHIINDKTDIYCNQGWYNTKTDKSELIGRAKMINGSSVLIGDTLRYDRALGIGNARRNAVFKDTTENVILYSHYADLKMSDSSVMATDSAVFVKWEQSDSLFLHGDTLYTKKDSASSREVKVYNHVRFFRPDMQGVCDSLYYSESDSLMRFYVDPCLWSDSSQITADYITLKVDNNKPEKLFLKDKAFIISLYEDFEYQQIKGDSIHGYFVDNVLDNLLVENNAEVIYFIEDENGAKTGIDKTKSTRMRIFLKDGEVSSIDMLDKPKGTIFPNKDLPQSERKLEGFEWRGSERPINKNDIFRRKSKPANTGTVVRGAE